MTPHVTARPLVIALPGFTRGAEHLARLARACNDAGFDCVRPLLAPRWVPVLYMLRPRIRQVAGRLAPQAIGRPVVVAGHSAGAAAGCALALELRRLGADVRGVVLIDGVDSPNHLIADCLPELEDVRLAAVLAPPSPCNRDGALGRMLVDVPQARVDLVDGAGHGDVEGAGVTIYRRACKDTSDEATAELFLRTVVDAISWAAGTVGGHT